MDIRKKKKVGVWFSVLAVFVPLIIQITGVLWAWETLGMTPLFLVMSILLLAIGIGVIAAAWKRIHEINGGEEDDLSQY